MDVGLNPPLPPSTSMDLPLPHLEGEAPAPPVSQEPFLYLPHQLHLLFLQHHPVVHIVLLNQPLHVLLLLLLAPLILSLHALSLEFSPLPLV